MTNFDVIFRNKHFFFVKQYIGFQKQLVEGPLNVLAKSLRSVFAEDLFIVNLLDQNSVKKYEDSLEHQLGFLYF